MFLATFRQSDCTTFTRWLPYRFAYAEKKAKEYARLTGFPLLKLEDESFVKSATPKTRSK